jgi:type IV pilus assembly protein PilB
MQAAQTGHLVLSTLHTNDAPSTLARLKHMGIAGFQVAASVSLVTAQRLIRCLCPTCKTPLSQAQQETWRRSLSRKDLEVLNKNGLTQATLYRAVGCDACHHGYKGRTGLYQIMPITPAMQSLIVQGQDTATLSEQAANEGVLTLRQAGWLKAMQGITSLEEVTGATVDA